MLAANSTIPLLSSEESFATGFRVSRQPSFSTSLADDGMSGFCLCEGLSVEGGVTMSAELKLTYKRSSSRKNTVFDLSGEYVCPSRS